MTVLIVCGTRPEAIKMAPVYLELKSSNHTVFYCNTGQHRDMMDPVNEFFGIKEDFNLGVMKSGQSLNELFTKVMIGVEDVIKKISPDLVLVHGDTSTSTASALAGFHQGVNIGHVEAGLRTYNSNSPFPEEVNRQITARLTKYHFCPTKRSQNNLRNEQLNIDSIVKVTGNTVIDALKYAVRLLADDNSVISEELKLLASRKFILVTFHRRENHSRAKNLIASILEIIEKSEDLEFVIPVHPNPKVSIPFNKELGHLSRVHLIRPLSYPEFVWMMKSSFLILTDSGGVQEEAPSLGKPVLVLRDETERPEAVEKGTALLVGLDKQEITRNVLLLNNSVEKYEDIRVLENPYGDGLASQRIIAAIDEEGV